MYRFRPPLLGTALVAVCLVVLWSLALWQYGRLEDAKLARQAFATRLGEPPFDAATPPTDPVNRRAAVTGLPDWDRHLLVAGKYMWGYRGYQLLVPVRTDGPTVLVDLGWVPVHEWSLILERERSAPVPRTFSGLVRAVEPTSSAAGEFPLEEGYQRKWRSADPVAMGAAIGINVAPWILVDGEGIGPDAPIADREPPVSGWRTALPERPHAEYAFTWFGLGLSLVFVWLSASVVKAAPAVVASRDDMV